MTHNQEAVLPPRAAVYIDGFNVYHAVAALGEPHLKWYCAWKLAENMAAKGGYRLVKVVFCTAYPSGQSQDTGNRYRTYTNVLKARGVTVVEGHYLLEGTTGRWSEKQSDVNLALSCVLDAQDNVFEAAYLVTADSDQAATARIFRDRFAEKRLIPVAPPGKTVPTKTQSMSEKGFILSMTDIETCIMAAFEQGKKGLIRRPQEYAPSAWWVHPRDRP